MKKTLSLLIALLLSASAFVSCAETADDPAADPTTADPSAEVQTTAEEDPAEVSRENVPDTLPSDLNLGGKTYTVHTYPVEQMFSEELTGEVVNDAVYERNNYVSERLNCVLECFPSEGWETYNNSVASIRASVASGSGAFDFIAGWSARIPSLSLEGLFLDLNTVDYLDFDQNWWSQSAVKELQLGGKLYFVTGDIDYAMLSAMCVYVFNQKVADENQIENLYSVVKEHRWTIDYVYDLTSGIQNDIDGNGTADITDYWGLQSSSVNDADGYMQGSLVSMMTRDAEGYPVLEVDEERLTKLVEKVYHLMWENPGCYAITGDGTNIIDTIAQDRALLATTRIVGIVGNLVDMESDYGILPYPLLDESQPNYGTRVQDSLSLFSIPIDAPDPNGSAAVMEALAAQSWRTVTPAYFDKALKSRYSRDRETSEMMDLIKDSILINFESLYNESIGNPWFVLRTLMPQKNPNFASYWASNKKIIGKMLDKAMDKIREQDA